MSKTEATKILAQDGIDWTAPFIDIVDSLTDGMVELGFDYDTSIDRADTMAARWAE